MSDTLDNKQNLFHHLLPAWLYRKYFLKRLNKINITCSGVIFKVAETFEERAQAIRLVHEMYSRRGIMGKEKNKTALSIFSLSSKVTIFIAVKNRRVIGTISLIEDSSMGLPMEAVHPREIFELRLTGRRMAEVGALAVGVNKTISMMLNNIMFRWARYARHIEYLVIAVHPFRSKFYQNILLFQRLGGICKYDKLKGALSIPLGFNMVVGVEEYRKKYDCSEAALDKGSNLFRFFVHDSLPNLQLQQSYAEMQKIPRWTDDEAEEIFKQYQVTLDDLPYQQRRYFQKEYPRLATV